MYPHRFSLKTTFFFVLPLLIILATVRIVQEQQILTQHAAGNTVTFTPTVIPVSAPEIGNPGRGPEYVGGEAPPPNWPQTDAYTRICWSDVETAEGQYNFAPIENALARAKKQGGMGGFRIMTLNPSGQGVCVPAYMKALMTKGFFINGTDFVPDWNDPNYIARFKALFQALAAKYGTDPRLGWIDLSGYGCWSEWHTFCDKNVTANITYPSSTGAVDATQATLQAIIDAQTQAFPNTRFLSLTANSFALNYALNLKRLQTTGIRRDCLGVETLTFNPSTWWQKAPLYGEYCGGPNFQKAQNDIVNSHISMIGDGDGNLNSFNSYSAADQNLMIQNYKSSGYRFILDNVTILSQIGAGGGFSVTSKWSNVNVAPAYLPWNVMFQLKSASGTVAWQGKSSLNLDTLLPTTINGTDTPITVTDTFNLPSSVANGTYALNVQIVDPNNYYPPLQLAIQGKQADGSYLLGTVTVGGSPGPTVPQATNTPGPTSPTSGGTSFSITVCPHGLGNCGDNASPNNGGNTNPQHAQRATTLAILDANGQQVTSGQGAVTYNSSAQNFQGTIPVANLTSGQYLVKIKVDGFLPKQLPGIITVTSGQTVNLPLTSLVAGDINNDNQIDILDYNAIVSCFGTKQNTASCVDKPVDNSAGADINDDGLVNGSDYNLFLRELSVQKGG